MMKRIWILAAVMTVFCIAPAARVSAQAPDKDAKPAEAKPAAETPKEESSVTEHSIRIGGQTIPYKATAATILLKDDKGEPTALLFSMAYTRSDVKDVDHRPLTFLYNGGPGSSSVWLHMGAFGPRRVLTTDPEATPPAPYQLVDNAYSLLDKSDLVFIDPVGTGFSHAVGKAQDKDFWGVDQDAHSLGQFVTAYVSRNSRWNSPKFLLGESYGTFRSAVLGDYLQDHYNLYLNGIGLVSAVLDLGTLIFPNGVDDTYINYLPSYAATAWYHKVLKDRPADLNAFLEEARRFAGSEYAAALMKGSKLTAAEKADMAKKMARFTGLSEDYLIKADLRVKLGQFMKELQRSKELTTGRLDARYSGPSVDLLAEFAEYDPQSTAVSGAYTALFNNYIRGDLKFGEGKEYHISAEGAGRGWDWKRQGERRNFFPGTPNVTEDLVSAMVTNPHLHVQIEAGLFDLATPFFAIEHTVDHLGLPQALQGHVHINYYDAGHMMYLREEDLAKLKNNVAAFIDSASKP